MTKSNIPPKQGLYDPTFEHDSCGIGFVVNVKGNTSHLIVEQALTVLQNLDHRGACGCEENTGDGAGILMQVPHAFLQYACEGLGFQLPKPKQYGVGMIFLPPDREQRHDCEKRLEDIVRREGQDVIGWRSVPTDNFYLGESAKSCEPFIRQVFIRRNEMLPDDMAFERKLYVIRKQAENIIGNGDIAGGDYFFVPSLSCKTLVYKGMLTPRQVVTFYPDLSDPLVESALAVVHSRFSTNTFPSWERAHPCRYIIHNGEINTLRGNENWMHARQAMLASDFFGADMTKLFPVIHEDGSDSAKFDNCLELLTLGGRSLPHAMMMMIPEPWENHTSMPDEKRAFYEYHSSFMEPWDGPASIAFTDGTSIGAVLDRNGLRPSRYYVTKDDLVIMASEVGVLDVPSDRILEKRQLQPGRMFLVDTEKQRIISDEELKLQVAGEHPYRQWLNDNLVHFNELPDIEETQLPYERNITLQRQLVFGFNFEDLRVNIGPMAADGIQPIGSMGTDTPLAVLSDKPQLLYSYFKQLFAQVTNPPIDPIREELITATTLTLGSEGNLLQSEPENCRQLRLQLPILNNAELEKIRRFNQPGFNSVTLPILFKVADGRAGLEQALDELFQAADQAIATGATILILSDKGFGCDHAPIPGLLASASLHHHLIRTGTRTRVGLVLESGEPREVHHFCLLLGYGVQAINPYMVFESLNGMISEEMLTGVTYPEAVKKYIQAAVKGIVKVMSKMGISTIKSYCGAQIFEAVGLNQVLIDRYFTRTVSRVGGIGLEEIALEAKRQHARAFSVLSQHTLDNYGQYQYRFDGELHLFNPKTIHLLQKACRNADYASFKAYTALVNDQSERFATLRGLMELKLVSESIPIETVEPVEEIVKRFKTGAMSYGSISQEAHEALAIAMNRIGGKSNTGEGGEDPARYIPDSNGDSRNSAIKQIASGRFGVTSYYLTQAKELQIKMAQGAKPGEGGELPGRKAYPWIARVRHSTPGVGLISPPPHHDIYSIEDLAQLIHDLKNANHHARISVKLVSEAGVGTIAAGVAKGRADVVLISGHDGGTGAAPQTSIKHAGLPWELGLAETHQTLVLNNLRSRIVVETDGQLKTGRDVVIAALLGAEEFGFATTALVSLGCIMMRVCHLDTCPVGVATQNPALREKFMGDPSHVVNFMYFIAKEMREIMAQMGFRTVNEMIGRTDRLTVKQAIEHWKAKGLDYSYILYQPEVAPEVGRYCQFPQDHGLENALDNLVLLDLAEPALVRREKVKATLPIRNTNRVVGTILGSEITRRYGPEGLPCDTIHFHFQGSAGQSFGAFIPPGLTLELAGDANDYFGKGLSGGKLIVYPPSESTFIPELNVIVGNVAFYGATGGEAYVRGMAGERFGVRNSGANIVVEGVGDHGCEYMTGGRVVVLGATGRNFGAGMSGGIAYVFDAQEDFSKRCNPGSVVIEGLDAEDMSEVKEMIRRHAECTQSEFAWKFLALWDSRVHQFVKVMPKDYRRMLEAIQRAEHDGLSGEGAVMAAFEENKNDIVRVSGN
ncbi:glutamate synthase (ferredoxin) [Nitrosomonas aestuarii]|uniref:Glutamate synthase [NADPH] large chain n=1 Tax=Nitrosomonas aestuarii TaxID=52441 RepID=A0A1I4AIJ8_9PROT|nr:glutamate synthase large subunit [Nitrosomonas aestuarii]SFK56010.1 glutamate synthase (ferredoxin) [Nitrosomonas aestuarii]